MKLFQTIQTNLALRGFYPNQRRNSNGALSTMQTLGVGCSLLGSCLVGTYFLFLANKTEEYMYSLFTLLGSISLATSQVSLANENDKIFNIIDMFEKLIDESEFQFYFMSIVENEAK